MFFLFSSSVFLIIFFEILAGFQLPGLGSSSPIETIGGYWVSNAYSIKYIYHCSTKFIFLQQSLAGYFIDFLPYHRRSHLLKRKLAGPSGSYHMGLTSSRAWSLCRESHSQEQRVCRANPLLQYSLM